MKETINGKPTEVRYTVIVKNGEQCDRDLRPIAPVVRYSCGHNHRTEEAAEQCEDHLRRYWCQHGRPAGTLCSRCSGGTARSQVTSAQWYNAQIHAHAVGAMDYLPPSDAEMDARIAWLRETEGGS